MRGRGTWIPLAVAGLLVAASLGFEAGSRWTQLNAPIGRPVSGRPTTLAPAASQPVGTAPGASAPLGTAPVGTPGASDSPLTGDAEPSHVPPDAAAFVAPALRRPLRMLDRGLATRGPRPTLKQLDFYQHGNPFVMFAPRDAADTDWRLSQPDQFAIRGYANDVSVEPGETLSLHLSGRDSATRIDIFRMGLGDAHRVLSVPEVAVSNRRAARPDSETGRIEYDWPASYTLRVPTTWRSGVYLAKLTSNSGGQSYVIFVVRSRQASQFTVVLPMMTYQAYNDEGGANLYGWVGGPHPRAYEVSFDRPFNHEYGAGLFFRLDFPLIVWLEDHGYEPAYVTDLDLARDPDLIEGATTLAFAGHGEYWTGGMRDTVESLASRRTSLLFFGANQAYWQVRLAPDTGGTPNRTIICYKDPKLDPVTAITPGAATTRFQDAPIRRPPSDLMGLSYGGIVEALQPMIIGSGVATFAPDIGLRLGQKLPGLIADEIDAVPRGFDGILLGATSVNVSRHEGAVTAGAALWINSSGGRTFDAGTFAFSWGLDPRYSAALPGFPAAPYSQLTARILAWAGTQPTR